MVQSLLQSNYNQLMFLKCRSTTLFSNPWKTLNNNYCYYDCSVEPVTRFARHVSAVKVT